MVPLVIFAGLVSLVAATRPGPVYAQSASPSPLARMEQAVSEDPAMTALATSLLAQAQRGRIDRTLFSAAMNDALTPAKLASVALQLGTLGKPSSILFTEHGTADGSSAYEYTIAWSGITILEQFVFDSNGKIAGWFFKPATPVTTGVPENSAMSALAASLVQQAQSGEVDRSLLSARMSEALTPAMVTSVAQQLGMLGRPSSVSFVKHEIAGSYEVYSYRIAWPSVAVYEQFSIDPSGKIAGWFFKPTT